MEQYAWVSEGSERKFDRAVAQLEKENAARKAAGIPEVPITEEAVLALYERWGGLVLGNVKSVKGVESGDEEAALARAEEVQPEKAKKVRSKK